MKRLARRKPLLNQETIEKAFRDCNITGDQFVWYDYDHEGWLCRAEFKHSRGNLTVYVNSNGTYETNSDCKYRIDVLDASDCFARACMFVTDLDLKLKPIQ
jgi:hypothetical protein